MVVPRYDFLLTRVLEIVVHADDLALSIDVLPPTFPDDASTPCSSCSPASPCADVAGRR